MSRDLTCLSECIMARKRAEVVKQRSDVGPLRIESHAFATRPLLGCFVHPPTWPRCCSALRKLKAEIRGLVLRSGWFSGDPLWILLLISMLALVQVFENNITACRVNTPFSCVLLYHTTSAFSTYALIEVLITFPQSCSRLKLAKFLSF